MWFFLVASILFHEDDPKVLDRQPPYRGPGYRQALQTKNAPSFPASRIKLLELNAWLPLAEFGPQHSSANDCWGYTSPSGREYAIIGLSHGTGFVEISNAADPQVIDVVAGPPSIWRDIKVYQSYAYAVSEGGQGIQVIDMSTIDAGAVNLVGNIDDADTPSTHNVALDTDSGFLYRCGGGENGLRFYSLSDPANPTYVGAWQDRYVHDAQIVTYTEGPYAGRQIAFCCAGYNGGYVMPGLSIVDVTDKENPAVLFHYEYSTPAYSHQGWLSEDRQYFFLNDELDERAFGTPTTTRVLNVSDLEHPFEVGTFTNNNNAIDHNMYTKGGYVFAANYRSGLRVFDLHDGALHEIAFYDTYPDDDNPNYNGLWSNYPYFESGTVIGSDIERGLFVWSFMPFKAQNQVHRVKSQTKNP